MILTVILTILKIIGIILASILGILLLSIILVVFVPIRYKASALRTGIEDDPPIEARGYVSWLLHIVHVSFRYPDKKIVTIRIFGIPIYKYPSEKKKTNYKKATKITKNNTKAEDDFVKSDSFKDSDKDNLGNNSKNTENDNATSNSDTSNASSDEIDKSENDKTENDELENDEFEDDESENGNSDKKSIFSRFFDTVNNIKCTIVDFCAKIKSTFEDKQKAMNDLKHNVHYYHQILESDLFERTFDKCKNKLLKLLKSILPRKWNVAMEVGFDDPYTTGEVLAIAGMLHPVIYNHISVVGNFEEEIIRGAAKLKGRIFVFSFVKILLFYLTDRDLKRLIKLFKKEETKRGRK